MVIMSIVSYPPEQAKEVVKRMGELPPVPSYMTMKGPYVSGELGTGIKAIILSGLSHFQATFDKEFIT